MSVNAAGTTGNPGGFSYAASMSADGRLVAFESTAPDLVPGDGNAQADAFLRDLDTGTTVLLSAGAGIESNWSSQGPLLAPRGTRVVFTSKGSKLVSNDFNRREDVFFAATGRELPTLPFADSFESGSLAAWSVLDP